jgi:hypothetical protein
MTHDTSSRPLVSDRPFAVAVAVVLVGLAVTTAAVAPAGAADGTALTVESATVSPGETTTVAVVVTSAPAGLAGYDLTVTATDGAVTVVNASYPDGFGLTTTPEVSADGTSVRLEAADTGGHVEPGASDVTLATLTLRGESAGEVRLSVTPLQVDADDGARLDPSIDPGRLVVGEETAGDDASADDASADDAAVDGAAALDGDAASADGADAGSAATGGSGAGTPLLPALAVGALLVAAAAGVLYVRRD